MDCLEGMKQIPNGSVSLVCTDLPYGTTANKWDSVIPIDKLFEEWRRVLTDTGTIYKAAGYELIDSIKADFYILPNGERVHPISMWHRHKTRKWEVISEIYPGIRKAVGFQLKFLKRL